MPTLNSLTLSVTIERAWQEVYDYAADPANLAHWAAGLGNGFECSGDQWTFHDAAGNPVAMRFADKNPFGVLDHDVLLSDRTVHMAVRVMPNGDGAEVTILVLQEAGMSDADFQRDTAAVRRDLASLKAALEG